MTFSKARWLEPVGQVIAFLAFSIQFFVVDPASNKALRSVLDYQGLRIDEVGNKNSAQPANEKETKAMVDRLAGEQDSLKVVLEEDARKQAWRPWLFLIFGIGALLTIAGKASSIKHSTK